MVDYEFISNIIRSNNVIKRSAKETVVQFLALHQEIIEKIAPTYAHLGTIRSIADVLLPNYEKVVLENYRVVEQVQLAVCGCNCSGKTSFVQQFLGIGAFLPTDIGPVTNRIVQFSYAPAEEATLLIHEGGVDSPAIGDPIPLSEYFIATYPMAASDRAQRLKRLKHVVAQYLSCPVNLDRSSNGFKQWASQLVEFRIPSQTLQLGITVYDTPGLYLSPLSLTENFENLIKARRPSLLFLYDNTIVSEDSRKCFNALNFSIIDKADISIFFLNTKVDVLSILNDAGIKEEEYEDCEWCELLVEEYRRRYDMLCKVSEMNSGFPANVEECDCFDIFSVIHTEHPMEKMMKKKTIDRILRFAAKHDLQNTRRVSRIVLNTIDTFFDFILVADRRSKEEWEKWRDDALRWIEEFFRNFFSCVDTVVQEVERQFAKEFRERCDFYIKQAQITAESTYCSDNSDSLQTSRLADALRKMHHEVCDITNQNEYLEKFLPVTVENELIESTLKRIVEETISLITMKINEQSPCSSKVWNELILAGYENILSNDLNIGDYNMRTDLIFWVSDLIRTTYSTIIESPLRKEPSSVDQVLIKIEHKLACCGDEIKTNFLKWPLEKKNQFKQKVVHYSKLAIETINHRKQAYAFERQFIGRVARIECRLLANLDSANHYGVKPEVNLQLILGRDDLFSVHPAAWATEEYLVARILLDSVTDPYLAYIQAHFYHKITALNIRHTVPLRYLYEDEEKKLWILLSRYSLSLDDYLCANMPHVTMNKAIQILLQITEAVAHMHTNEVDHGGIKPRNIFLDDNLQVYLANPGTCQHGTENMTLIESRLFAPELTKASNPDFAYNGPATDVYALGLLMYAVAPKQSYCQIAQAPTHDQINELINIPSSYTDLMCRCLSVEPKSRPTTLEMIEELEKIATEVLYPEKYYYEKCKNYYRITRMPIVSKSDEILSNNLTLASAILKFGIDEDHNNNDTQELLIKICNIFHIEPRDIEPRDIEPRDNEPSDNEIRKKQTGSVVMEVEIFKNIDSTLRKIKIKALYHSITDELREEMGKLKVFFMFMGDIQSLNNPVNYRDEVILCPQWNRIYDPGYPYTYWPGSLRDGRDRGPHPYYCPIGWRRVALHVCDNYDEKFEGWSVCYHGTKFAYGLSILLSGLKPAIRAEHGPGIYASPSIIYASHPRYSEVKRIESPEERSFSFNGNYVQFVLQCRVHPKNIQRIGRETLTARNTTIDPNIKNGVMEWVIDTKGKDIVDFNDPKAPVVCTGLMIRVTDDHPGLLPESKW